MEPEDVAPALKKIRLEMLEPELQREITELAAEMGYEATITTSSNLHFLYEIYRAEKARGERDAKALKKAEDMILRLSSLHHSIIQREEGRRKAERSRKVPLTLIEGGLTASKRMRELLESVGIKDEKIMEHAAGFFSEDEILSRVELIQASNLWPDAARRVFGAHPETIMIAKHDEFISEIEAMENKKAVLEGWVKAHERDLPIWADYNRTPGILLDSFEDITRQLEIRLPETSPMKEEGEVRYRGKPMDPRDFMKVTLALGFFVLREATHGTLLSDDRGKIMCVQKAHRSQMELNQSTIKKKLNEAGVDLDEFEKKRRELRL
ncbi:MAG: hypothetical protein V1861_05250 [Candidatus Micrarchaeota archaeon]